MTATYRRHVGRAHRRRQQGREVRSFSVAVAYLSSRPDSAAVLRARFAPFTQSMVEQLAQVMERFDGRSRKSLIHNGRKPR